MYYYLFGYFIFWVQFTLAYQGPAWKQSQVEQAPLIKVVFELEKRHFEKNEPIPLKVTFQNIKNSTDLLQLRISSDSYEHFNLNLEDQSGLNLPVSPKYFIWKNQIGKQANFTGEKRQLVELAYLETYTTVIDLLDWFEFETTGLHFLNGHFIYNPQQIDNVLKYQANDVSFVIDESFMEKKEKKKSFKGYNAPPSEGFYHLKQKKMEQGAIDRGIAPYEVVEKFLKNQQRQLWGEYFDLIHLEKYLLNSYFTTDIHERYLSARELEKEIILTDFKHFLINSLDYEIESFEILKTLIEGDVAEVSVGVKSKSSTLSYVKKFNPSNGQVELNWEPNKDEFLMENKVFYFNLEKYYNQWKIVEKRIGNEKSQKFFHSNKPKQVTFGNILFYQGTTNIVESKMSIIDDLIQYLRENKKASAHLYGHTDNKGSTQANEVLSKNRVETIKNELLQTGVNPQSVYLYWYGETKPIYSNSDEKKMALNRRVEIKIENSFNN